MWTWLVIAAYAQLWLARNLAASLRLPWQRPAPGARQDRKTSAPAARHDVGKNHKETTPKKNAVKQTG